MTGTAARGVPNAAPRVGRDPGSLHSRPPAIAPFNCSIRRSVSLGKSGPARSAGALRRLTSVALNASNLAGTWADAVEEIPIVATKEATPRTTPDPDQDGAPPAAHVHDQRISQDRPRQ